MVLHYYQQQNLLTKDFPFRKCFACADRIIPSTYYNWVESER